MQVGRGGKVNGGRAEEAGGADPNVETTPGVEDVVDKGEGGFLRRGEEGVGNDFGVGGVG